MSYWASKWVIGFRVDQKQIAPSRKTGIIGSVKAEYITWKILVKGFPEDSEANLIVNKAYKERGIDLVLTLIWENGTFRVDRKSMVIGSNGYYDYGLCQLNYWYHKKFIDSPDFNNWEKQLDYCIGVRDDAIRKGRLETTFYAYNIREKYRSRLLFP